MNSVLGTAYLVLRTTDRARFRGAAAMSTTPPTQNRTFLRRWKDFWFSPGDPTALGFMRVVTGLLVLYTHLTYSLDLQAFFGKFGWYGSGYIERERKEFPWQVGS